MHKLYYNKKISILLFLIPLILSIILANIYSIRINFVDDANKFSTINTFAVNNNIKNYYNITPSIKYQFESIGIYNSLNRELVRFDIHHSITGEHIISIYKIFNHVLYNKLTLFLNSVSQNTHLNILFINLVFSFILFYLFYLCIIYAYKRLFSIFVKIDFRIDKIGENKYIAIGLLLSSLVLFSVAYFTNQISEEIFTNSDELFLFDMVVDLMHGGNINNWHLPGAFQFFPAMPILAIISVFTTKIYYIAYYYAIIQILFFYFVIAYWLQNFLPNQKSYYLASIFIFVALYLGINFNDYNFIFIHSFHFETFILGIFYCGLILNCYKNDNTSINRLLYLSIIQILAIMSDKFFIIWIVAPLLFVLSMLYLSDNYFKKYFTLKLCILITFNTIIALFLYKISFIHIFAPSNSFIFSNKYVLYNKIMSLLLNKNIVLKLTFICLFIFYLNFNQSIKVYYKINHLFRLSILLLKILFLLLITIIVISSYFAFELRYCIPLFYINIFILIFFCYQIMGDRLSLVLTGILLLLSILNNLSNNKLSNNYANFDIKCIESVLAKYQVKHGISDYWIARKFNYMNQSGIDIIPIEDHKHVLWMDNEIHEYNIYDFAITHIRSINSLDLDSIIKSNGNPEFRGRCYNYEIIIYKNGMLKYY